MTKKGNFGKADSIFAFAQLNIDMLALVWQGGGEAKCGPMSVLSRAYPLVRGMCIVIGGDRRTPEHYVKLFTESGCVSKLVASNSCLTQGSTLTCSHKG